MSKYRIYNLDQAGRIMSVSDAECASDDAAFVCAASIFGISAETEIWKGARCLGRSSAAAMGLPR